MRWEFGFTCGFCLLHETDLGDSSGVGAEGTGVTWVEHRFARSSAEGKGKELTYSNCYYACQYCNLARGNKPVIRVRDQARLLDPVADAWADHFELDGDELVAKDGDASAEYTWGAYDIDDIRKIRLRQRRFAILSEAARTLAETPALIAQLRDLSDRVQRGEVDMPLADRTALLRAEAEMQSKVSAALAEVARFGSHPADAPSACLCSAAHATPACLAGQYDR